MAPNLSYTYERKSAGERSTVSAKKQYVPGNILLCVCYTMYIREKHRPPECLPNYFFGTPVSQCEPLHVLSHKSHSLLLLYIVRTSVTSSGCLSIVCYVFSPKQFTLRKQRSIHAFLSWQRNTCAQHIPHRHRVSSAHRIDSVQGAEYIGGSNHVA